MAFRDGGSVGIDVVPKIDAPAWGQQIQARLDPVVNRAGRALGRTLAEGMKDGFAVRRIEEAIRNSGPRLEGEASKLGRKLGREIARSTKAELEARLKNLPDANVSVKVRLDEASVERVRQRLSTLGPFTVTINVDADTAAAMARLQLLRAEADRLFSRSVNINVGANTAQASSALTMLGIQLAALAAIPFGSVIAAGLGAIAASATAAGAGVAGMAAVAIPGITRIAQALQAQKTADNQVATSTRQRATALNTAAIATAQAQLRAMAMAQAERQVTTAQRAARQAQVDLNAARQAGARSLEDMQNNLIDAGLALRGDELAVQRAKQALDALNASRADEIAAQRAQAELSKANADLAKVLSDPNATAEQKAAAKLAADAAKEAYRQAQEQLRAKQLERKEAQLAYEQAVQQLKQQRIAYERLRQDERRARREGVEGTDEVKAAKERLRAALEQVAEAQRAVRQQQIQDRIAALQAADAQRQAAAAADGATAANVRLGRALDKLTPAERELMEGWKSFSKVYREWVNDLEPDVLPVLAGGMALVSLQLSKFSPLIRSSSAAFRMLETRAALALDGPFWSRFIARLSIEAPNAIEGLGNTAGHTFTGIAGIIQAFLPYTNLLLTSVDRVADRFADWGTSLEGSSGFIRFMGYIQTNGPEALRTLVAIGDSVLDVGQALSPLAGGLLLSIRLLAEFLGWLARTNPELLQMAAGLFLVSKAVRVLGFSGLIAGLTGTAAAATGASAGLMRFGAALRFVGGAMMGVTGQAVTTRLALLGLARLGLVVGSIAAVGYGVNALQNEMLGTVQSVDALTKSMQQLAQTGKFTGAFTEQFKASMFTGRDSLQEFKRAADEILAPSWKQKWLDHPFAEFTHWITFGQFDTALQGYVDKFKQLDVTLTQMAQRGQADQAAAAFARMAAELQKNGFSIERIKTLFPQYNALVGSGAFQTQIFTEKIKQQNQALSANARAFMSSEQEVIDFNSALAAGRTALDTNGRAFWGNSQAAINNRSTVLQAARVLQNYTDDLVDNNRVTDASIKRIRSQREQLIVMAQKFGLSRKEAERYVDQLVKIPKKASTNLSVNAKGKFSLPGFGNLGPLSDLLKGLGIVGNAGGGYIGGSGGPRADNYLTRISAGEMVMNAPATARYGPVLAAWNDEGNRGTVYKGRGYGALAGGGMAVPASREVTDWANRVEGFAGGGIPANLRAASFNQSYSYSGEPPPVLHKARDANLRGLAGQFGYVAGQTAIGAMILSKLMSGGFGKGAKAVQFAIAQLGEPYVWGATGPDSWDCSGLTQAAWKYAGVQIPRVTYDQIAFGTASSRNRAMPGDLVFPSRGHVMMVTGRSGAQALIHAPHTGDVVRFAPWRNGTIRHIAGGGGSSSGGGSPKAFAKSQLGDLGWSSAQWSPLNKLWQKESGWRWNARNPSSGAYGIPQALPPDKMASFGMDWLWNPRTQIRWGLAYIKARYGSPSAAWAHSQRTGWYADGTTNARRGLAWVGERGPELVDFRGGERVFPHEESLRIAAAATAAPIALDEAALADGGTHMHAHFDGTTRASVQHEVTTAFHAMQIGAAANQRIKRRR